MRLRSITHVVGFLIFLSFCGNNASFVDKLISKFRKSLKLDRNGKFSDPGERPARTKAIRLVTLGERKSSKAPQTDDIHSGQQAASIERITLDDRAGSSQQGEESLLSFVQILSAHPDVDQERLQLIRSAYYPDNYLQWLGINATEQKRKYKLPTKRENSLSALEEKYDQFDSENKPNDIGMIAEIQKAFEEIQDINIESLDDIAFLANFVKVLARISGVSHPHIVSKLNKEISNQILCHQVPFCTIPKIVEFQGIFDFFLSRVEEICKAEEKNQEKFLAY